MTICALSATISVEHTLIRMRYFCLQRLLISSLILLAGLTVSARAATPIEIPSFGSNPGALRMFEYVPEDVRTPSPLVVVLHGCRQNARDYALDSGWLEVADRSGLILILPDQLQKNNSIGCFNWFEPGDNRRGVGEALSIKQMTDSAKSRHAVDPRRIFVSGLSAGGAMTTVMLATYPDVFAGGAMIAGLPYGCANNLVDAVQCMSTGRPMGLPAVSVPFDLTGDQPGNFTDIPMSPSFCFFFPLLCPPEGQGPAEWGQLVRDASDHAGPFPILSIWHGSADTTVDDVNATEAVEQWTNVHGISSEPTRREIVNDFFPREIYEDADGNVVVDLYIVPGMAHGKPVDPGAGPEQCGRATDFVFDVDICSSHFIAEFWGLTEGGPE